jgi:hypothetical protein
MINVETRKLDELTKIPTQLLAVCNTTGNRVLCNQWQQTSFLDDEAIWWRCPDCKGWHLIVIGKAYNTR